ncbi:MAG: amidase [Proteobacteria bacterium]|nr:amidase [Pseudomonadota bacterium]
MTDHILDQPILDIAAQLRAGRTSAQALVDEAIARHQRLDKALGAYKHWDAEGARAQARAADAALKAGIEAGPLAGIPVSIKDIYGVAGMPTCAGTPKELPARWREEGPVVRAMRRSLAVVTGKTHTVEFAFGAVGRTGNWPSPRNPWDAAAPRACGGSSAGAGVSLAEGSALIAMGTDTGGSIRIPANVTGQVGFKLTHGRWSTAGIVPLSSSFDTPGPLTRSVRDAIVAFAVIDPSAPDARALFARLDATDPAGIRLGMPEQHFWDDLAPGIGEGLKKALDELAAKGMRTKKISFPEAAEARARFLKASFFGVEGVSFVEEHLPDRIKTLDPNVATRFEIARKVSAIDYFTEMRKVAELAAAANARLAEVDALVAPTVPVTVPTLAEVEDTATYVQANGAMTRNTQPINLLGLCAITIPAALDAKGMPVGLQLVARAGAEERLLAVALACEKVLGTARARLGVPPVCRG